jgi:hypothetical protein
MVRVDEMIDAVFGGVGPCGLPDHFRQGLSEFNRSERAVRGFIPHASPDNGSTNEGAPGGVTS